MDVKAYDRSGKLFLSVVSILCVSIVIVSLTGQFTEKFTPIQWFITIGLLFTSVINSVQRLKQRKIFYAIGLIMIVTVLLFFAVIPQMLKLF